MRKSPAECKSDGKYGKGVSGELCQENEREDHGEGVHDSGQTDTGARGRDMGIEEGKAK